MPLACGGSPGVAKPGLDRLVYVGAAGVGALAELLTDGLALVALSALIGGSTYDLLNVCGSPDPGDPGLTHDDLLNALEPQNPLTFFPAQQRIQQWFVHMMWPIWCNCADGTAPPPSTAANPPAVGTNDGLPSGTQGVPCWNVQQTLSVPPGGSLANDVTRLVLPFTTTVPVTPGGSGWPSVAGVIPTGVTSINTHVFIQNTPVAGSVAVQGNQYDSSGTVLVNQSWIDYNGLNSHDVSLTFPILANAHSWTVFASQGSPAPIELTIADNFLCGASPGTLSVPCCPPDPSVDIRLRSIQSMLEFVMDHLPSSASSTISVGTVHPEVTGNGSLTLVASCAAVRVHVTSDLSTWPNHPGVPNYYLSMGFITSIAAGSPLKGWRLVYGSQTFPIAAYADQIGYTLPAGVTAVITELLPG